MTTTTRHLVLGCAAVVVALLPACSDLSSGGGYNPASDTEKTMAKLMCEDWVKERLKSPSTAEFGTTAYEAVTYSKGVYRYRDTVDSQNSFGAMVRTEFECMTKTTDQGETWTLIDLTVR